MKIIRVVANKKAEVVEIDNSLKSLQTEVGGYIECFYPFEEEVCLICNDEGKINGSPLNRAVLDADGDIMDIIAGTFLIANCEGEDFGSLTDEQLNKYYKMFERPELFVRADGKIHILKM